MKNPFILLHDKKISNIRGILQTIAVTTSGFGDRRKAMLEDMAILTGGVVIAEGSGQPYSTGRFAMQAKLRLHLSGRGLFCLWSQRPEKVILINMLREDLIQRLIQHKPFLMTRYGVKRLALFGSYARGSAQANSDIDVLVEFSGTATAQSYFGLQFYLEDLLGKPIDLVTEKALRPDFRPYVEQDLLTV